MPNVPEEHAARVPYALLPADRRALRENFVHHWGWLWVAGKEIRFAPGASRAELEILIPGVYTLEAEGPIVLAGARLEPGAGIELATGLHAAETIGDLAGFRLRWGRRLPRPAVEPSPLPLFTGF
jgi:hypothetical protein